MLCTFVIHIHPLVNKRQGQKYNRQHYIEQCIKLPHFYSGASIFLTHYSPLRTPRQSCPRGDNPRSFTDIGRLKDFPRCMGIEKCIYFYYYYLCQSEGAECTNLPTILRVRFSFIVFEFNSMIGIDPFPSSSMLRLAFSNALY